jgi:hypothetical protein
MSQGKEKEERLKRERKVFRVFCQVVNKTFTLVFSVRASVCFCVALFVVVCAVTPV